jgi:3-deoxy-D-manno-octulosonic-acid transferase
MTLRVYRKLSYAMVPLSPALISRRLKLGKEDPERFGERRGLSADVRPTGPLVWIHGASVGEVLAAAALIERLRALNLRILLTSGTVTSAAIVAKRFPPDVIHQYVPYDSPRCSASSTSASRSHRPMRIALRRWAAATSWSRETSSSTFPPRRRMPTSWIC